MPTNTANTASATSATTMNSETNEPQGSTSIRISIKTRDRVAARGKYGDSFDSILNRILDEVTK